MKKLLVLLLLLTPLASAHDAPGARELDTRVLADGEGACVEGVGLCDYGNMLSDDGVSAFYEGGPDLLALDMREAWVSDMPGVLFRILAQRGDTEVGPLGYHLGFNMGETHHAYSIQTSDRETFTSEQFLAVRGPEAVGDGFPYAIEGFVPYFLLAGGLEITNITMTSTVGASTADLMPGGFYYQGNEVPDSEAGDPGTYTLTEPPALFEVEYVGNNTGVVAFTSNLVETEQFLEFQVIANGATVQGLGSGLILPGGESRNVPVNITATNQFPNVLVVVRSDKDYAMSFNIPVEGLAPPPVTNTGNQTTQGNETHDDHDEKSPGIGMIAVAGVLGVTLLAIRRRL